MPEKIDQINKLIKALPLPKKGLYKLKNSIDVEDFNILLQSKEGKIYTADGSSFSGGGGGSSALFPNGVKEVPVSRNLTVEDVGWLLNLQDGVIVQPAEGITLAEGDIIGITGTLTSSFKTENDASLAVHMLSGTFYQNETVVLSATNADGLETILVPISTILIADGDVYKTALRYLYDQSQNAIPLSGTVSGSPVTGDIEIFQNNFDDVKGFKIKNINTDLYSTVGFFSDGNSSLSIFGRKLGSKYAGLIYDNEGNIATGLRYTNDTANNQLIVDELGVYVTNESGSGLIGSFDYSSMLTDLSYPQKKYVDTHIAFTTVPSSSTDTGVKGQMAVDANYLYVCVATDTWTRIALSW